MHETNQIADLIVKKIRGSITPGEQQELDLWLNSDPGNQALYMRATDPRKQLDKLGIYKLFNREKVWANLEDELFGTKTVRFTPQKILRYAAAIFLPLLIAGGFAYIFLNNPSSVSIAEIDELITPGSPKVAIIPMDDSLKMFCLILTTPILLEGTRESTARVWVTSPPNWVFFTFPFTLPPHIMGTSSLL